MSRALEVKDYLTLKKGRGRPRVTPPQDGVETAFNAGRAGKSIKLLAFELNVPHDVVKGWKKTGKQQAIFDAYALGREDLHTELLQANLESAKKDPKALDKLLERLFPEKYGRQAQDSAGPQTPGVVINLPGAMDPELYSKLVANAPLPVPAIEAKQVEAVGDGD